MSMKKRAFTQHYLPRRSDRNCAAALICLLLAIFLLSVVVFTFTPTTPAGLTSTGLGVLCMSGCIFFFARYSYFLKREQGEPEN